MSRGQFIKPRMDGDFFKRIEKLLIVIFPLWNVEARKVCTWEKFLFIDERRSSKVHLCCEIKAFSNVEVLDPMTQSVKTSWRKSCRVSLGISLHLRTNSRKQILQNMWSKKQVVQEQVIRYIKEQVKLTQVKNEMIKEGQIIREQVKLQKVWPGKTTKGMNR